MIATCCTSSSGEPIENPIRRHRRRRNQLYVLKHNRFLVNRKRILEKHGSDESLLLKLLVQILVKRTQRLDRRRGKVE
ncbi:hypothetical protein AT4G38005, partial [Arabidopsis thaliana]